jgi:hypothetical protein
MSLPRSERQEAERLLSQIRDGMERLEETTPSPPESILQQFNSHFKDEDKSISRPVQTNGLVKIQIHKSPSFEIINPLVETNGRQSLSSPQNTDANQSLH